MENSITVEAKGEVKSWSILLRGINEIKAIENAVCSLEKNGVKITPESGLKSIKIDL